MTTHLAVEYNFFLFFFFSTFFLFNASGSSLAYESLGFPVLLSWV